MDDMKPKRIHFGTVMIFVGLIIFIIGIVWWSRTGVSKYYNFTDINKSFDGSSVQNLKLDFETADVKINAYNGSEIKVEGKNVIDDNYTIEQSGDTFKITVKQTPWYKSKAFFQINIGSVKTPETQFTVSIPDKLYKTLEFTSGVGSYEISSIHCESAVIDLAVGDGTLKDIVCTGKADIDTGVGDCDFTDCTFAETELDCGVGDITYNGKLIGKLDINGGVGDCTLNIDGLRGDYDIDADKGVGDLSIHGDKKKSSLTERIPITIDAGVGDITLRFN